MSDQEYDESVKSASRREFWRSVGECFCGMIFIALVGVFCWLCCEASGYHWE